MAETLVLGSKSCRFCSFPLQHPLFPKQYGSFHFLKFTSSIVYQSITMPVQKSYSGCICLAKSRNEQSDEFVKDLRVPEEWTFPSTALQESEWLRISLHKWLDDEYCPEIANEEISKRCAKVYYHCLMERQVDLGEILMQMVRDLETFSFRESFHGAFSSANAAVHLITRRIQALEETQKS